MDKYFNVASVEGSNSRVSETTPEGVQLDPIATSVLKAIQEGKITIVDAQQKTKGGGSRKKTVRSETVSAWNKKVSLQRALLSSHFVLC